MTRLVLLPVLALAANLSAQTRDRPPAEPPTLPVGFDAYLRWDQWPLQRIGARAYMRSTYDRRGGNETADASHFLYQVREDFNVTLDVEGAGILYFARYNHWHGSPWHYEVDGRDHVVQETTTADPSRQLEDAKFLPESAFPQPLTATYALTKGADLSWVPIGFERRFRMAYSRTFYGTGYYIWHQYLPGAKLSRPIASWSRDRTVPDAVLGLLRSAGGDIAPQPDPERGIVERRGNVAAAAGRAVELASLRGAATIRALKLSAPRADAIALGHARLRATWDGRGAPSVDAPVALFFGTGTLYNRDDKEFLVEALPVNVRFGDERVELCCYFPMPFFRSARVELVNASGRELADVRYAVRTEPLRERPEDLGYFHATYRDHPEPRLGHDLVFLDTDRAERGGPWSGSFVGTSFTFSHDAELGTLEGDPRFFFDDSQTPQCYGTGTEEWGGGGDYWGGRTMTLPLVGHPVGTPRGAEPDPAAGAEGRIESAYRFLLADLMPFGRRAVIRFEHGGTNQRQEHYESVAFWYGAPRATLVETDRLDVGDAGSEAAHDYRSPDAGEPYELTSRYEWGPDRVAVERGSLRAQPVDYAEFELEADAGTRYHIWVRGRSSGGLTSDATWFQFDGEIGTARAAACGPKGFGNWRDDLPANRWGWCSELPGQPPRTVTFERGGRHRLRVQRRHGPHDIDRIWLSATQRERPAADSLPEPRAGESSEIVLTAGDAVELAGGVARVTDEDGRTVLRVAAGREPESVEVFPAQTVVGRRTATHSEFTLTLREDNAGVLLRRTLDYGFPNQRARVLVADAGAGEPEWRDAGVWYLAGSNTCYHSYPRGEHGGELGASNPVVQTSNRRLRDDEFLLPRALTRGRSAIRVRVEFTPVRTPLLPGRELGELAWSEIAYRAYCYVLP